MTKYLTNEEVESLGLFKQPYTAPVSPTSSQYLSDEDKDKLKPHLKQPAYKSPTFYTEPQRQQRFNESLDHLENDDKYIETSERFLKGIGQDDTTVESLYEYFRDADYNLARGAYRAFKELPNLSPELKKDYSYLRERFESADTGGLKQYFRATKDIGIDVISDPTMLLSLFFLPWTGGGSLAARQALAQTAKMGLKRVGKSFVKAPVAPTEAAFLPAHAVFQSTKQAQREAVKKYYNARVKEFGIIGAGEGAFWGGMDTYLRQERDDVDGIKLREGLDYFEIAGGIGLGAVGGAALTGGASKIGQKLSVNAQNNLRRFSDERLLDESDFIYRAKMAKDKVISKTIGKPTARFITKAEDSTILRSLLRQVRYDTFKWDMPTDDPTARLSKSYGENLGNRLGEYLSTFESSLIPILKNNKLVEADENILLDLMRSHPNDWSRKVPEATEAHKKAIRGVRYISDKVLDDSREIGIFRSRLRKGPNSWMARRWKWSVVNENQDELAEIMVKSDAITLDSRVLKNLLEPEDLAEYNLLKEKYDSFETIIGKKDQPREGWSSAELAALGDEVRIFEVFEHTRNEMNELLNTRVKNQVGLREAKFDSAHKIIDDMLDKKHLINEIDAESVGTMGPSSFSPRSLWMLDDFDIAKFIDDDFKGLLTDYFTNSARLIERKRTFGITDRAELREIEQGLGRRITPEEEFARRWIDPIRKELKANGKTFSASDSEQLTKLFQYATGLNPQWTGAPSMVADALKLTQQVAHLPFATVSSLTEIIIPLSRVNAGTYARGMAQTIKHASKKMHKETLLDLQKSHGLTKEEAHREMHRVYLGIEQALSQRIDGLYGEGLQNTTMRKMQSIFFKTNLLTQWTRTVQLASFTMGKDLITRNLRSILELETQKATKALSRRQQVKLSKQTQQLLDLDIDISAGKRWIKGGEKIYSGGLQENTNMPIWNSFYENQVMRGASRFANEVILDPSKSSVIRPNIQQSPIGSILFQFLGYPTAFNNTVLKNYIIEAKRNPITSTPKILNTSLLMTALAAGFNGVRSGGEEFEKEPGEIVFNAVRRWGGLGFGEYAVNARNNAQTGASLLGSTAKAVTGPTVADIINQIQYGMGPAELVGTNLPFYGLYRSVPVEPRIHKRVKDVSRGIDQALFESLGLRDPKKKRIFGDTPFSGKVFGKDPFVEGGKVDREVPRTPPNPSSRIDKMTGLPYEDQAGDIIENREDFRLGGLVSRGAQHFLRKYFKQGMKQEDVVNDPLYSQVRHIIDDMESTPDPSVREHSQFIEDGKITDGQALQLNEQELQWRKDSHIEQSEIKDDVILKSTSSDPTYSNEFHEPVIGQRVQFAQVGQENVPARAGEWMFRGKIRVLNSLKYDGDIPDRPFLLLYDKEFMNMPNLSNRQKEFLNLRKEYEMSAAHIERLFKAESIPTSFDKESLINELNIQYNKKFYNLLEGLGYDSIQYNASPLARPRIRTIGGRTGYTFEPILPTARESGQSSTVEFSLMDEAGIDPTKMQIEELDVVPLHADPELAKKGISAREERPSDIQKIPEPDTKYRRVRSDVEYKEFEPLYTTSKGRKVPVPERALTEEYTKNPSILLFRKEQWYPSTGFEAPSKFEIKAINDLPVEERVDFINENSIKTVPTQVIKKVFDDGEAFHIVSTATDDSPMGRVISIEKASPDLLHSLKNRIDLDNTDQTKILERLKKDMENITQRVYVRIDTIPGIQKQVIHPGLRTQENIINAIKINPREHPTEFWHHPKGNNPLTEESRLFSLINIDADDIKGEFSPEEIIKMTIDSETLRRQNIKLSSEMSEKARIEAGKVKSVRGEKRFRTGEEAGQDPQPSPLVPYHVMLNRPGRPLAEDYKINKKGELVIIPEKVDPEETKILRALRKRQREREGWETPSGKPVSYKYPIFKSEGVLRKGEKPTKRRRQRDEEISAEGAGKELAEIGYVEKLSVKELRDNPNKVYLFGDNLIGRGKAGQAIIRDEPNAVGIPTKKSPSMDENAFFNDAEFAENTKAIDDAFNRIPEGSDIVVPEAGLGTGLARLESKAPRTFEYLNNKLAELRGAKEAPSTINIYSTGKTGFEDLSNLAPRPFEGPSGRQYYSVEHAYQSIKSGSFDKTTYNNPKWEQGWTKISGGKKAKTEDNWNVQVMEQMMKASFEQNPRAMELLKFTGDSTLTHTQDKGIWKTEFPRILMKLRDEGGREGKATGGLIERYNQIRVSNGL